jgi:hypothetical protein
MQNLRKTREPEEAYNAYDKSIKYRKYETEFKIEE